MISTRSFTWLSALLTLGVAQACSADATTPGSTGSPNTGGSLGVAGSTSSAGSLNPSSGGSSPNGTGGTSTASGGDSGTGGHKGGGKGGAGAGGSDAGGTGGSSSAGSGNGGQSGAGGSDNGGNPTPIGTYILTFYSFQDNTPVNSMFSASGHLLTPFVSVAVPFTQLKDCGGEKPPAGKTCGTLNYGDKLFVDFLKGRKMPNGMLHTGWVLVDDYCGDGHDDTYCYEKGDDKKTHPIVDIYIGDFSKSGMMPMGNDECTGPIGNGSETVNVSIGNPGALFLNDYGGAALGTGKCGDRQAARDQQYGPPAGSPFGMDGVTDGSLTACWGYDGQGDGTEDCKDCQPGVTCAK